MNLVSLPFIAFVSRYAAVGIATAAIYAIIAYFGPIALALTPVSASLIGYTLAVAFQYVAHAKITFRVKSRSVRNGWRFVAAIILGYLLSTGLTMIGEAYAAPRAFVVASIVIILPVMNLVLFKLWVFTDAAPAPPRE